MAEPALERLLTPDDVAKRLAVSRSMAYTLIKRGELRALRVGRFRRIDDRGNEPHFGWG